MRTVTVTRTNQWLVWDRDAGGWAYRFGMRDMLATEHVHRVLLPSGQSAGERRVYDDVIAVQLGERAEYPDTITVEVVDRAEWFAQQRRTA